MIFCCQEQAMCTNNQNTKHKHKPENIFTFCLTFVKQRVIAWFVIAIELHTIKMGLYYESHGET